MVSGDAIDTVLGEHERYYRLVLEVAADAARRGDAPLDAARGTDLGAFSTWADHERLVLNLHRAMADAAGAELDLVRALLDAVTYLGGPMRTHVCAAP